MKWGRDGQTLTRAFDHCSGLRGSRRGHRQRRPDPPVLALILAGVTPPRAPVLASVKVIREPEQAWRSTVPCFGRRKAPAPCTRVKGDDATFGCRKTETPV